MVVLLPRATGEHDHGLLTDLQSVQLDHLLADQFIQVGDVLAIERVLDFFRHFSPIPSEWTGPVSPKRKRGKVLCNPDLGGVSRANPAGMVDAQAEQLLPSLALRANLAALPMGISEKCQK
jgi:hypothetical protein